MEYERLANAIILQAVSDYRWALNIMRNKHPKTDRKEALNVMREVETFFRSSFYSLLTTIDGEFLIKKLREE